MFSNLNTSHCRAGFFLIGMIFLIISNHCNQTNQTNQGEADVFIKILRASVQSVVLKKILVKLELEILGYLRVLKIVHLVNHAHRRLNDRESTKRSCSLTKTKS